MFKDSFFLCVLFLSSLAYSQEFVEPLQTNPDLFQEQEKTKKNASISLKSGGTIDSTFIYILDTLTLPFFDEFSRDNFQVYPENFEGENTTSELYYSLLDTATMDPLPDDIYVADSATFRLEVNLDEDTTIMHVFDGEPMYFDPLTSYPVNYELVHGYPPYIVIDSIENATSKKDTVWLDAPIFTQDSARVFTSEINNPNKLWVNRQAYHNYRFAKKPWSLGVATFDGLDENGYPYNFGSTINQTCDTLLSKPIDLSTFTPNDSVYFSFLYQTEGYGDPTEEDDSLYVDFYNPQTEAWNRVWAKPGAPPSDFKVAHLPLTNNEYFENGFQFRFMNYCTPAGMLDHFHIDYVNLRAFSGYQDTLFKDFAFVYPISTLIEDYIQVPWKHYRNLDSEKMSDSVRVTVRNGSELTENNQDGTVIVEYKGEEEGNFTLNASILSGGEINYEPRTTYTSFHDFTNGYAFDPSVNDSLAVFDWIANASAQFPSYPFNDSTFGQQVFKNCYAYDDGTAEKAWGVFGTQSLAAYKFDMYEPDELIAIQIHFVPTVTDISNNLFLLAVWDDDNGAPGDLIYEDEFFFPKQPKYAKGRNAFTTYYFQDQEPLPVGETFYVGWRQIDEDRMTVGFDMNHDNSDKIFWSVDGGNDWKNSSFKGSLMIRPIINSNLNYLLDIEEHSKDDLEKEVITIYPNPVGDWLNIETSEVFKVEITDLNGRLLLKGNTTDRVNTSSLSAGMYLVHFKDNDQIIETQKLVKK